MFITSGKDYVVAKTDEQWRAELSPKEYKILREAGTERPWSGKLNKEKRPGLYTCRACGARLFRSEAKFDAGCGWPSFFTPLAEDRVELLPDDSLIGRPRVEVRCANCGSHLGHVFDDAPETPTGDRYCMNSLALQFAPDPK